MILFPAIDLVGGKVVRLQRGDRSRMDVYSDDPAAVARDFAERGAEWIHVVDLSATFEEDEEARAANAAAIRAICATPGIKVDCGGGVRSIAAVARLADLGVQRIAIGTALVRDPAFAERAAAEYGEQVVADVAAKDGVVKVNGWREGAGLAVDELLPRLAGLGFSHLVFTDINRDGMQTGIDVDAYRRVAELFGAPVVASGGITSTDDLRALAAAGSDVIEGAITGRALYEGSFSLAEALLAASRRQLDAPAQAPRTNSSGASRAASEQREPAEPGKELVPGPGREDSPMLTKRVIPCLDVKDGRVVKGVNFVDLRDAGDPVELASKYDREGADEVVFLDITATSRRSPYHHRSRKPRRRAPSHSVYRGRRLSRRRRAAAP